MPHIIRTKDIFDLHKDFINEVFKLRAIWDDKQYDFFLSHYAEPLAKDLKEMKDKVDECVFMLYDKQSKLESL